MEFFPYRYGFCHPLWASRPADPSGQSTDPLSKLRDLSNLMGILVQRVNIPGRYELP